MDQLIVLEDKQFQEIREYFKFIKKALEEHEKSVIPRWVTTSQTATMLHVKSRSVHNYVAKSKLHPKKVGGILLFDREEIESLIEGSVKK